MIGLGLTTIPGLASEIKTLLSAAAPLSAHHQWPVSRDKLVTVKGTVTDFATARLRITVPPDFDVVPPEPRAYSGAKRF